LLADKPTTEEAETSADRGTLLAAKAVADRCAAGAADN